MLHISFTYYYNIIFNLLYQFINKELTFREAGVVSSNLAIPTKKHQPTILGGLVFAVYASPLLFSNPPESLYVQHN